MQRITRLYDGLEQLEDAWGDEDMEGSEITSHLDFENSEERWTMDDDGHWIEDTSNGADWTDDEDNVSGENERWSSSSPTALLPLDPEQALVNILADAGHQVLLATPEAPTPPTVRPTTPDVPKDALEDELDHHEDGNSEGNSHWKRFEVLSSAPPDHAFYSSAPAQPSRSFLARLTKEYRVLSTTLPGLSMHTFEILVF